MSTVGVPQITEQLQKLPSEKLVVVYDFVSYLLEREGLTVTDDGEEAWDELLARPEARQSLREMAGEALDDFYAGRTTDIIITDEGLLAPG